MKEEKRGMLGYIYTYNKARGEVREEWGQEAITLTWGVGWGLVNILWSIRITLLFAN